MKTTFSVAIRSRLCSEQSPFIRQSLRFLDAMGDAIVVTGPLHVARLQLPLTVLESDFLTLVIAA